VQVAWNRASRGTQSDSGNLGNLGNWEPIVFANKIYTLSRACAPNNWYWLMKSVHKSKRTRHLCESILVVVNQLEQRPAKHALCVCFASQVACTGNPCVDIPFPALQNSKTCLLILALHNPKPVCECDSSSTQPKTCL